ncbi:PIG-L deacetylase family protein [Chitinophaga nivalis]|uniref:PIG-L family deacetylase n=1 Tax=Chitinophaga nivalis TaxID=2991709 RepID=A0ABT3IN67_9BACT|nr:PIG-L family deacetylase [Chitinophaga nivalis]MCW3464962.1 PIG-L family deacetylase [Chitinophaga nivalis]MCW3485346.1 PIG-L family deacetylase [Chitinophaga nivalis]
MKTMILEPHFDDTAYSMTGWLLLAKMPADTITVTVFTRSTFAPYAEATGVEAVSALRYAEHKAFCQQASLTAHLLGYEEAPQRGWAMEHIFDNTLGAGTEWELQQRIQHDFRLLHQRFAPDQVYAPLGICGHIDHLLVRECAAQVFPGKISYYEDLPYAGEIQPEVYDDWIHQLTQQLYPRFNRDMSSLDQRIAWLRSYRSQVAEKDIAAVRQYIHRHQGERCWSEKSGI